MSSGHLIERDFWNAPLHLSLDYDWATVTWSRNRSHGNRIIPLHARKYTSIDRLLISTCFARKYRQFISNRSYKNISPLCEFKIIIRNFPKVFDYAPSRKNLGFLLISNSAEMLKRRVTSLRKFIKKRKSARTGEHRANVEKGEKWPGIKKKGRRLG